MLKIFQTNYKIYIKYISCSGNIEGDILLRQIMTRYNGKKVVAIHKGNCLLFNFFIYSQLNLI